MARRVHNPAAKALRRSKSGAIIGNSAAAPLSGRVIPAAEVAKDVEFKRVRDSRCKRRSDRRKREREKREALTPEERAEERAAEAEALQIETEWAFSAQNALEAANDAGREGTPLTRRQSWLIRRWDLIRVYGDETPWSRGADYAKRRLRVGYVLAEPKLVNDKYWVQPFIEKGLRSTHHMLLRRFVASLPAARNRHPTGQVLTTGDKEDRYPPWTKLEGCDDTHGSVLAVLTGWFRVELDSNFATLATLVLLLNWHLPQGFLPHIITWNEGQNGEICHPHLWFCLPAGKEVRCFDDSPREPQKLLESVAIAYTKQLIPIGADMSGACNFRDGKLPTCPHLSFAVLQDTDFPDLYQMSNALNASGMDLAREIREQAVNEAVASGEDREESLRLFVRATKYVWTRCRKEFESGGDSHLARAVKTVGGNRAILRDLLYEALLKVADTFEAGAATNKAKLKELMRIAKFCAKHWNPLKAASRKTPRNVGLLKDDVGHLDNTHDRQSAGSRHCHKAVKVASIWRGVQAIRAIGNGKVNKAAVARVSGLNKRTVARHWQAILEQRHAESEGALWSLFGGYPVILGPSSEPSGCNQGVQTTTISAVDPWGYIERVVADNEVTFSHFNDEDPERGWSDVSCCVVRGRPGRIIHNPNSSAWVEGEPEVIVKQSRQRKQKAGKPVEVAMDPTPPVFTNLSDRAADSAGHRVTPSGASGRLSMHNQVSSAAGVDGCHPGGSDAIRRDGIAALPDELFDDDAFPLYGHDPDEHPEFVGPDQYTSNGMASL